VNLALHDVRRQLPRFLATAVGLGLLFTIVLAMGGIYRGLVDDAVLLVDRTGADLWVVQRDTRGPFAERSVVAGSLESRAAAVPGVAWARAFTTTTIQRDVGGKALRATLVGLAWPDDRGAALPLVAGRALAAGHRELVADVSLGLELGQRVPLADETYTVVGLTKGLVSASGDGLAFLTNADVARVEAYQPPEAVRLRRLADRAGDDAPMIAAVAVRVAPGRDVAEVRARFAGFADVSVTTTAEQRELLLGGVVDKSRRQIGLFRSLLVIVSAIVVSLVIFNMTVAKTREIALLKLMGARLSLVVRMIVEQSLLLCVLAYGVAVAVAQLAFDKFPRRVAVEPSDYLAAAALVVVIGLVASAAGVRRALSIPPTAILAG
jgi:putative ABC transport system permease protein